MSSLDDTQSVLGDVSTPAPKRWHWVVGGGFALIVHVLAALPFLPNPEPIETNQAEELEAPGIEVRLAPVVQPPSAEDIAEPEPDDEEARIEERSSDSPPPAPPDIPRELPDLPDIQPRPIPELWIGDGSSDNQLTLEEYLFLQAWLKAARKAVLEKVRYPDNARRLGITGNGKIVIIANRSGRIVDWRFLSQTGEPQLDGEIQRTVESIRRLPPFPEGTRYETLSYVVTVRFELVKADGTIVSSSSPNATNRSNETSDLAQDDRLSVDVLSRCAATAAQLETERDAINAERASLEALVDQYGRQAETYARRRQPIPRRLERQLEDINERVDALNPRISQYQSRANAYRSLCGGGSTTFESYRTACGPYAGSRNGYCEAFGAYWARLNGR